METGTGFVKARDAKYARSTSFSSANECWLCQHAKDAAMARIGNAKDNAKVRIGTKIFIVALCQRTSRLVKRIARMFPKAGSGRGGGAWVMPA